ncbi:hypothetical protein B0H11DRAFT_1937467 [Mycena galericulata]|nr:hypothetical protein B0H11DRAFT_1937467 [Mycena galericulata]
MSSLGDRRPSTGNFLWKSSRIFRSTDRTWSGTLLLLITDIFHGNIFGASPNFDLEDVRSLLNCGPKGHDGFCEFFDYFLNIGFPAKDLQDAVLLLEHAIEIRFPTTFDAVLNRDDSSTPLPRSIGEGGADGSRPEPRKHCQGLKIDFPPGKNAHTSYPFGLHATGDLPWGYHSIGHDFYLRANKCRNTISRDGATECSARNSREQNKQVIAESLEPAKNCKFSPRGRSFAHSGLQLSCYAIFMLWNRTDSRPKKQ